MPPKKPTNLKPESVEIGATGTIFFRGLDNIYDNNEYVNELTGQRALTTYNKMRRGDAQVKMVLDAMVLPILSANWSFKPPGDPKQKDMPTPEEEEATKWMNENILEDEIFNFKKTLKEALNYFWAGSYWFENLWRVTDDGKWKVWKLEPRLPDTIREWEVKDGILTRVRQRIESGETGRDVWIPANKLTYFVLNMEGNDYRGMSMLRAAYKHWFYKDGLYRVDAISKERWGVGVPKLTLPVNATAAQKEAAATAIKNLRSHQKNYVVLPNGYELELLDAGSGKQVECKDSINHHNAMIAKAVLAQFLELGMTEVGARSLGDTLASIYMKSLQGYAEQIAAAINSQLVSQLTAYNFGNIRSPKLVVSGIAPDAFEQMGRSLEALGKSGYVRPDDTLDNFFREMLGLPITDKTEDQEDEDVEDPETDPGDDDLDPSKMQKDIKKLEAYKQPEEMSMLIFYRPLRPTEEHIAWREIHGRMDDAKEMIVKVTRKYREDLIRELLPQMKDAFDSKDPAKIKKIDYSSDLKNEMASKIEGVLGELYQFGQEQVSKELARQGSMAKMQKPNTPKNAKKAFKAAAEQSAEVSLDRTVDQARSIANVTLRANLFDVEQIVEQLEEFSDNTTRRSSGYVVNDAINKGRTYAADQTAEEIEVAEYSCILDGNQCVNCNDHDGQQFKVGSPEYEQLTPPLYDCLGGDQCRCIWVYILATESPAESSGE